MTGSVKGTGTPIPGAYPGEGPEHLWGRGTDSPAEPRGSHRGVAPIGSKIYQLAAQANLLRHRAQQQGAFFVCF